MMWTLLHRRADGSFVVELNGSPYHVIESDPLFAEVAAAAEGVDLPPEPPPEPPPPAEPAILARARRSALLVASDWTQLSDSPLSSEGRAAWSAYRAALRGVPQQPGFPTAIEWPLPPAQT